VATDERRERLDCALQQRQHDLTVLAVSLHKPRNFSAVVRTCDAVGINEMHAVPGDDDISIHWKTSQGAEKWVDVRTHNSVKTACHRLRTAGFQLVAAHLSDQATDYRELDYTRPTALLVGTELFGVSEEALALSDRQVMIPMLGVTQSLNVSVACAIVLYEALRQRQAAGMYDNPTRDEAAFAIQRFEWLHPQIAQFCRERSLDYPPMDEEGNITGEFPRA